MSEELKLNVFVSWSGQRSGEVAKALKAWMEATF